MPVDLAAGVTVHVEQPVLPAIRVAPPSASTVVVVPVTGPPGRDGHDATADELAAVVAGHTGELADHEVRLGELEEHDQARGYRHLQSAAAAVWQIPHQLGYRPAWTAHDTDGAIVDHERVDHPTLDITELTFGVPIAGYADGS